MTLKNTGLNYVYFLNNKDDLYSENYSINVLLVGTFT